MGRFLAVRASPLLRAGRAEAAPLTTRSRILRRSVDDGPNRAGAGEVAHDDGSDSCGRRGAGAAATGRRSARAASYWASRLRFVEFGTPTARGARRPEGRPSCLALVDTQEPGSSANRRPTARQVPVATGGQPGVRHRERPPRIELAHVTQFRRQAHDGRARRAVGPRHPGCAPFQRAPNQQRLAPRCRP